MFLQNMNFKGDIMKYLITAAIMSATIATASADEALYPSVIIEADSCKFSAGYTSKSECPELFLVVLDDKAREIQLTTKVLDGAVSVSFFLDAQNVDREALADLPAFFAGYRGSLKIGKYTEETAVNSRWAYTDGDCKSDGSGNWTCSAVAFDELVVFKLKGIGK